MEDFKTCQTTYGKTILLSLGGTTYTEGGFASPGAAIAAADNVWAMLGPQSSSSVARSFGAAVVDGFDLDFESNIQNMVPFANQLHSHMDSTGKRYLLSITPQCMFLDAYNKELLDGQVFFDLVMI